jgi:hypothetical protein
MKTNEVPMNIESIFNGCSFKDHCMWLKAELARTKEMLESAREENERLKRCLKAAKPEAIAIQ